MRAPRRPNLCACDMQYHLTKLLLIEYAMPGRALSGAILQAAIIFFMNLCSSDIAYLNCLVGSAIRGSMCAAIDATLTIAKPAGAIR
jgi:hypothetical protein